MAKPLLTDDLWERVEPFLPPPKAKPKGGRAAVRNNGGGHYNHSLFWTLMAPAGKDGALQACAECGMGFMAFTPLAQGMLTDKYIEDPALADARVRRSADVCAQRLANRANIEKVRKLNVIARRRGQSLAQMAIVWLLRRPELTSVLIGASRAEQIEENVAALANRHFAAEELAEIEAILGEKAGE